MSQKEKQLEQLDKLEMIKRFEKRERTKKKNNNEDHSSKNNSVKMKRPRKQGKTNWQKIYEDGYYDEYEDYDL